MRVFFGIEAGAPIDIRLSNGTFEFPLRTDGGVMYYCTLCIGPDFITIRENDRPLPSAFAFGFDLSVVPKGGTPTITAQFDGAIRVHVDPGSTNVLIPGEAVEIQEWVD
jgi:hypothetical protein